MIELNKQHVIEKPDVIKMTSEERMALFCKYPAIFQSSITLMYPDIDGKNRRYPNS